ncbi:MAG: heavy metal-binding domain-containing protein, partial [Pacificimonas sp.]
MNRAAAEHLASHGGDRFYFCSARCKEKFEAAPETYLKGRPTPEPMPAGTTDTCPMHPEIEQVGPGECPICGMALEPKGVPPVDDGPNPELVDFTRRFWVGAVLSVPLVVIAMGPMVGLHVESFIAARAVRWFELVIATPAILYAGWPFIVRGWRSFRTWNLNMFSLIAMGVVAAYLFSAVAV